MTIRRDLEPRDRWKMIFDDLKDGYRFLIAETTTSDLVRDSADPKSIWKIIRPIKMIDYLHSESENRDSNMLNYRVLYAPKFTQQLDENRVAIYKGYIHMSITMDSYDDRGTTQWYTCLPAIKDEDAIRDYIIALEDKTGQMIF